MKKVLTFLLAILPFYLFAAPTIVVNRVLPITNLKSCEHALFNVSILNADPGDVTLTTFTLNIDSRLASPIITFVSPYSGSVSTVGSTTTVTVLASSLHTPGSPPIVHSGSSAVSIFTYAYDVPCLVLPLDDVVTPLNLSETINCSYSKGGAPFTMAPTTITNALDYANLLLSPIGSTLSTLSNMGATTRRVIRLESAGTVPSSGATDFNGYIQFYDHNLSCNYYKIKSLNIQIVNRLSLVATSIYSIIYSTPILPPSTPLYTTPSGYPIIIDRPNEYLVITEDVVLGTTPATDPHCIDGCPGGQITNDFDIYYGCNDPASSTLCNHIPRFNGIIQRGTAHPVLDESAAAYTNSCFLDPVFTPVPTTGFVTHTRTVTNSSTVDAYNVRLRLRTVGITSTEAVRRGSLKMYATDGITIILPSVINRYTALSPGDIPTCIKNFQDADPSSTDDDEPIANADWEISVLHPGEHLTLEYTTFRCCPSDVDRLVGNFTGPEFIDVWRLTTISDSDPAFENVDECDHPLTYHEHANLGPTQADLSLGAITGPSDLTGSPTCDVSTATIYRLPLIRFCGITSASVNERLLTTTAGGMVSGILRVEITTQRGLNPSPGTPMRLTNIASPYHFVDIMTGFAHSSSTYSGISGGTYYADFDLATIHQSGETPTYAHLKSFLESSYLTFPITPCCPGDENPEIKVQWYLIPSTTATGGACVDCKIPLAQTTKLIQLHCPGCVTPGIIVDECLVERVTPGYIDTDNNGVANDPTTYTPYTDVAGMIARGGYPFAGQSFMRGDQIRLNFEAKAQDGDDLTGVTYSTLMTEWGSHTTGYPSPSAFTDLNIEVFNPCAATDQFDWVTASQTLIITRVISGTTTVSAPIDITPYLVSTGRSCFYRVPASATGPFVISVLTSERYAVSILFNTCGNGDAQECAVTTRMWWSGVSTHDETSWDGAPHATEENNPALPTPLDRAALLLPDMIYLCEANGSAITGFHLLETYGSRWADDNDPDHRDMLSCNKALINTYSIRACGPDELMENVFPYEYRPIMPNILNDNFVIPNPLTGPVYIYSPAGSISGSAFETWVPTAASGFSQNTRALVVPSSLSYPSASWSITGPYRILTDVSLPSTAPSPSYILSDEQTNLEVNYNFVPTLCATPGTLTPVSNTTNHIESSNPCSLTLNTTNDLGHSIVNLRTPNPTLQFFVSRPVSVYSTLETCFDLQISNISSGAVIAENIVIHIPAPSIGGTINSIVILGTPPTGVTLSLDPMLPDGSRYCTLNHLLPDQLITLTICFNVNTCDALDPLEIGYTFGCTPLATTCLTETIFTLPLLQADVKLYGSFITAMPVSAAPCSPIALQSQFLITQLGEVSHIKLFVTLPVGVPLLTYTIAAGGFPISAPCGTIPVAGIGMWTSVTSGGMVTYTITLNPDFILTLLPCANQVMLDVSFWFGTCTPSVFYPKVELEAQKYCDQFGTDLVHLAPPLIGEVNVVGGGCTPPILGGTTFDASCLGHSDGSINATVTGIGTYTYSWSLPISSTYYGLSPSGLAAGAYTLFVRDEFGCVYSLNYTVGATPTSIPLPTIASTPPTTCDPTLLHNSIVVNASTGTSTYVYSWTATNSSPASGSISFSGGTSTINLAFLDPTHESIIEIKVLDPVTLCYNILKVTIPACCVYHNYLASDIITNEDMVAYSIAHPLAFTPGHTDFRVNGVVTVTANFNLDNCTFYMEPYSEIVVNSAVTLTLNSCIFVACDNTMWKGFRLAANSQLVAGRYATSTVDTRIYDALAGITTNTNAVFHLDHVDMNRNFIDIDVKENTGAASSSSIINSNLYCNTETPYYAGSSLPPTDGTMFIPHVGEKTFIGVRVVNNNLLNIGQAGGTPFNPRTNYFSDMNFGILSTESGLDVINNHITHLYVPGGDGINFTANNPMIGTYVKNLHAQFNTYSKIPHACIFLRDALVEARIEDENMDGAFGILSANLGSRTVGCDFRPIRIYRNYILFSGAGVQLEASYRIAAEINDANTIVGPFISTPSFGIRVSGVALSTAMPRFRIDHNVIKNGLVGISIQNVLPTGLCGSFINLIGQNYIYTVDDDVTTYRGIELTNASSTALQPIEVTCNAIRGVHSLYTALPLRTNFGISLNSAQNNSIRCNDMDELNRGFSYTGTCTMPNRLAGNTFRMLNFHVFGAAGSSLGDQPTVASTIFPANRMTTIALSGALFNNGANYKYAFSGIGDFNPDFRGFRLGSSPPSPIPATPSWFTCPTSDCVPPPPTGLARIASSASSEEEMLTDEATTDFALTVKQNIDSAFVEDEEGLKKLNEELLFVMLQSDSSLLLNDTLQEFYDQKQSEHTGILNDIRELMNEKENSEAEIIIANLPINNEVEETNKVVYEIWNQLEQTEDYTLTDEEMELLQVIANYCPIRFGQAVYSARVLIQTQYGYESSYWVDEELCVAGIDFRRKNPNLPSTSQDDFTNFVVYPNPASTELNFKVISTLACDKDSKVQISICDILGNKVLNIEYEQFTAAGKINISILANGAYVLKYFCKNTEIYHASFIVNK